MYKAINISTLFSSTVCRVNRLSINEIMFIINFFLPTIFRFHIGDDVIIVFIMYISHSTNVTHDHGP